MKNNFKNLQKFIAENNVIFDVDNTELIYSEPSGQITEELRQIIIRYNNKLIKYYCPVLDKSNLMSLNTNGDKIPLFLVHGNNANYFLKNVLGKDQPLFGYYHFGSAGEPIPFYDVRSMAKVYLKQLLEQRPKGPYNLAGFSLGGILAYEMAIMLQDLGHEVSKLVLFDCKNPTIKEPYKWHKNLYSILRKNILGPFYYLILNGIKDILCNSYIFFKQPMPVSLRSGYIYRRYVRIIKNFNYKLGKYSGKLLLFRAEENDSVHEFLGWDLLADDFEMITIKGNHDNFFQNKESIEQIVFHFKKFMDS